MSNIGYQKMSKYFEYLFLLKKRMEGLNYFEQDKLWMEEYKQLRTHGNMQKKIWFYLALIHPDFYFSNGRSIEINLPRKNSNFSSGITTYDRCQHVKISGVDCVFNEIPSIRGKCQADHIWPNSLGGPSILDNRLLLCKYHNSMKSNNVSDFYWDQEPIWLMKYLNQLARLKN